MTDIKNLVAILTDSYKSGHAFQYPSASEMVAYGEFRKSFPGIKDERIVFYGIRYIVENYLMHQWTEEDVAIADKFYSTHNVANTPYPFPKELFLKFVHENNGYFPVKIEALQEGSVVYPHVPVYQVTATGEYSRLVTFLETLLTMVWYPTTVATYSRLTKTIIKDAFDASVDDAAYFLLNSRLHDFGFRGCTSVEQSIIGGTAHLLNFEGSDTMSACFYAQNHLNEGRPVATSIPATEHSVMTAYESELEAVENMVELFGHSVFACVMDSYDYEVALHAILPKVANKIKAKGGLMVVRPDSGDPVKQVILGLHACNKYFGSTINLKGFMVLNNSAVIQGDGIDYNIVKDILDAVLKEGFSAQNVAFGMGGGLLQKVNRDTLSFATKLSHITYADGTPRDIMKAPKTDSTKFSLPGKLQVSNKNGIPTVFPAPHDLTSMQHKANMLQIVYDNGPVDEKVWDTFDVIRERVEKEWSLKPIHADVISDELKAKIKTIKLIR